jgi:predicted dehydrogenase
MQGMSELNCVESLLVIGTGSAGCRHLMNAAAAGVAELSVFSGAVERRPLPGQVRVETDLSSALSRKPQAVVIANQTSLHVNSALGAARAGCHLLIEKPLSDAFAGLDELQREVADQNLVAMVGYQFRFHPTLQQIRSWLMDEAIGPIVSANVVWGEYLPDWQPWRDYRTSYSAQARLGGGVLLTLSHPIDYLRWLLGEVVRVNAMTARLSGLEIDVEDTAIVQLEFESGAIVSVSLDYVQRPSQHQFTVVGREGVIRWDNKSGLAVLDRNGHRSEAPVPAQFERNDLFVAELDHFFHCVARKDKPACSLEDGQRTLQICVAAKQSARFGRSVNV